MARMVPDAGTGNPATGARTESALANAIPALLITGLCDAAKFRFLDALMLQRPATERWAVMTPGLTPDRSIRPITASGVEFATIPVACMCCTGLLPFRVGLIHLLRRMADAPANRLIIIAGREHHAATLVEQLRKPAFKQLLHLHTTIAVVGTATGADMAMGTLTAMRDLCAAADFMVGDPGAGPTDGAGDPLSRVRAGLAVATPMLAGGHRAIAERLGIVPALPGR